MKKLKTNPDRIKSFEIKDFAWQGLEFNVSNHRQGKFIYIKLFRDFNLKSEVNDIYFVVEEKCYSKKRTKVKRIKLSSNKFSEVYQKLKNIKLNGLVPKQDYDLQGPTVRLEIKRGNSKIQIEWIYDTQPGWKKLDELILYILTICREKRILRWKTAI